MYIFIWDFPTLCQGLRYLFICGRKQIVRHVVSSSTRKREDPVNEAPWFFAVTPITKVTFT